MKALALLFRALKDTTEDATGGSMLVAQVLQAGWLKPTGLRGQEIAGLLTACRYLNQVVPAAFAPNASCSAFF